MKILHPGRDYSKGFTDKETGKEYIVKTLEEDQYPEFFGLVQDGKEDATPEDIQGPEPVATKTELKPGKHIQVMKNQKGISFDKLFGDHLKGAASITIQDPYIRYFYQAKNLSELIQLVIRIKPVGEELDVKLVTKRDDLDTSNKEELLFKLQESLEGSGINFTYEYDDSNTLHHRYITSDTGWKIILGDGLGLFHQYDYKDSLSLPNNI